MQRPLGVFVESLEINVFPKKEKPVTFSIAVSDKFQNITFYRDDLSTPIVDVTADPDAFFATPNVMDMNRHYFKLEEFTVDLVPGRPAYAKVTIENISGEVGGVVFFRNGSDTPPVVLSPSSDMYRYRKYGIHWVNHEWWITSNRPSTLEYMFEFNIPSDI